MTSGRTEDVPAQGARHPPRPGGPPPRHSMDIPGPAAGQEHGPAGVTPRPREGTPGKPGPPQCPDQAGHAGQTQRSGQAQRPGQAAKAEPAANARPGTTAEGADTGIAVTTIIRELCWDAVPPLAVYVTLGLIGVSHWLALLAATLVAASRVIWALVRAHALNPYALLVAELLGLDLALSYLPGDARLPLVTGSVTAAALGITWLVMLALGHPPTLEAAKLWDPERAAWRVEQFRAIPEVRHGYRLTSTVWGAAFLTEAIALALLIYVVPRAAMSTVTNAVSIAYLAALIGWIGWYQRQLIHGAQEHRPGPGDAGGEQLRAGRPGQQAAAAGPATRPRPPADQPAGTAQARPGKQG